MSIRPLSYGLLVLLAACGGAAAPPATTAAPAPPTTAAPPPPPVALDTAAAAAVAGDGSLHATSIVKSGTSYELVLNGVIKVGNVRVVSGADGKFLGFPQREDEGQFYDYITVSREAAPALVAEVEAGRGVPGANGFAISKVEIRPLTTGKSKAFVTFHLNDGAVKLFSFKLLEGDRGLWLTPPSEKVGNDWVDVIQITDRDFKKALENAAIEAYRTQ